jgi:hypothetical protein
VDGLVDEKELAGRAALPGAEKRGGHAGHYGLVDVGIVEHDDGPVAAHLKQEGLPGGALGDLVAISVEPTNPIAWVPGLATISSPTTRPGPVTRLNTPTGSSASTMHSASLTAQAESRLPDLVVRLGMERLPLVERQRAGEVVAALGDEVCDPLQRFRPPERRPSRPFTPG